MGEGASTLGIFSTVQKGHKEILKRSNGDYSFLRPIKTLFIFFTYTQTRMYNLKVCYSDVSAIQMFTIQIPTVHLNHNYYKVVFKLLHLLPWLRFTKTCYQTFLILFSL